MLACDKAVPAEPLSWDVSNELADLFGLYMKSDPAPEKLSRLQYLLGISDSTAAALREMGDSFLSTEAEEENFVFWWCYETVVRQTDGVTSPLVGLFLCWDFSWDGKIGVWFLETYC